MTPKIKTYRAIIVGVAIILIVAIGYLIYRGIVGVKNASNGSSSGSAATSSTTTTSGITPVGSGQVIKENAPVNNQGVSGSASQYNVVPVSNSGTSSSGSSSNSGSSGGSGNSSGSGSSGSSSGSSNPCPDYLGDQHACVPQNYTIYGTK
jgi:hypothetical protein